jgi:hypothetical protein
LFAILGLKAEEEKAKKNREGAAKHSATRVVPSTDVDVDDTSLLVDDHIR